MIGHSFGQLVALYVSDSISTEDTFRLISERARLLGESPSVETGAMLSVECDREEIEAVIRNIKGDSEYQVEIACHNGPRSFVLAGNAQSIDKAEEVCGALKKQRLQNTHAYHSYVMDGILPGLKNVAESITMRQPRIHVETCSSEGSWVKFDAEQLVQHTRSPVYFGDAVERIAARLPSAVWLEAGSSSPVVAMARRIIPKSGRPDIFILSI